MKNNFMTEFDLSEVRWNIEDIHHETESLRGRIEQAVHQAYNNDTTVLKGQMKIIQDLNSSLGQKIKDVRKLL